MSTLATRDSRVLWHPYTQHGCESEPLAVASASGAWLELADGTRLIDGISSWWAILHGHGHPHLVAALSEQAATLDHVLFAGATHEPAVRLGERIVEVAPEGLSRVFYSDDGSTAVEVALKMILRRWSDLGETQRRVFLSLEGAYHGDTFGAMAASDPDPFFVPFAPFALDVRHVAPTGDVLLVPQLEVEPVLRADHAKQARVRVVERLVVPARHRVGVEFEGLADDRRGVERHRRTSLSKGGVVRGRDRTRYHPG